MIREAINLIIQHISLSEAEMAECMSEIMEGRATDAQIGAFLTALRIKGETVEEISGAVRIMREKATRLRRPKALSILAAPAATCRIPSTSRPRRLLLFQLPASLSPNTAIVPCRAIPEVRCP